MVAIRNTKINRDDLPTKEDLIRDPEKRNEFASKALSMKPQIKDSDSYWIKERHEVFGCCRYLIDPDECHGLNQRNFLSSKLEHQPTTTTQQFISSIVNLLK